LSRELPCRCCWRRPGVVDVSTSWLAHLPQSMVAMLDNGQKQQFDAIVAQIDQDPGRRQQNPRGPAPRIPPPLPGHLL